MFAHISPASVSHEIPDDLNEKNQTMLFHPLVEVLVSERVDISNDAMNGCRGRYSTACLHSRICRVWFCATTSRRLGGVLGEQVVLDVARRLNIPTETGFVRLLYADSPQYSLREGI